MSKSWGVATNHRNDSSSWMYWRAGALLLFCVMCAGGAPPPTGVAPVTVPAGGFGIDGDLIAGVPTAGVGDWLPGADGTGGVLDTDGIPLNPATTFHFIDAFNSTSDNTFVGGLKWTDNPNIWSGTTGKASSKTDINNVLLHVTTDAGGHTWLVIAADRLSTSGDSYIDFEFLQNPLYLTNNNAFFSAGPNGGRTVNDILLSLAFTSGGSVADFFPWTWQTNGAGGYSYVDATASLPAGKVFVAANSTTVAVPFGAFGLTSYAPNAFAEAAIDLTALLGNFNPCLSIGVKTIMVKTKTSQSSTATISDFINPIQYNLRIGPSAIAGPNQTRCTEGDSTAFPLNGTATPGLYPIATTSWSVVSGTAIIDAPSSLVTTAHVASATATLRLSVIQANGCTETSDVLLSVAARPPCSIAGPTLVCPRSISQFTGPPGLSGYAWSISGNGQISGPTNAQVVSVIAGPLCGTNFTVTLNDVTNICSSGCSLDAMVNDTNPPVITAPRDLVLECPADTRTNVTGVATAQDDCAVASISYVDSVTNTCGGAKIISRLWTATDLCGNTANAVQTITVLDTTPPSLVIPGNLVLECPADTSTNRTGTAIAHDACGSVLISYSDVVSNSCGGARVISRLWTAVDQCGNSTNAIQMITVRDTTPPSLTLPPNLVLECPADTSTNFTGVATAQDTCSSVQVTYSDIVSNSCGGTRTVSRLWTATDACGNTTSGTQRITVRDTTPPSLVCPPDLVLECPADTSTNATGVAIAEDACGSVTLSYHDTATNNCGGSSVIHRMWTAVDACGNSTNAVQMITIRDTTPPSIFVPPDLVLECPADTRTNATGVATAQDGCGAVSISYSDVVTNNCGNTKVIARTWRATDGCGNFTNAIQRITVLDTTPPSITCPPDLVLECPADTRTNVTGVAVAHDGCSSVTVSYSDVVSNTCGGAKVISRLWTATDACGNSTNGLQTITVRDTTPPSLTVPASLVLECPADTSTNRTGTATALDACGSALVSYSDIVSNGCGGSKVISRLWTAVDQCGNSTNAVQTITVRDTTPPSLTLPANLVLECPADTSTNRTGVATAQDTCSSVQVTYSDIVSNRCGGTRIVSRLWTATDACGNSVNGVQTITVRDTTPPSLSIPSDLVLECPADITTNHTGVAVGHDTCSSVTISYSDIVSNNCGGSKVISRLWTAIDECGNSTNRVQTITVRDTSAPSLVVPPNLVLECPADTGTNITGVAISQDGCGSATVTFSDIVSNTCGSARVVFRTWTATDACGNTTNKLQTITVRDTTPPSIFVPASLVLECPADTTTNATGVAVAQDGCGQVTVRYSDVVSNICGGAKVIRRLWTAVDSCGNSTNGTQTITVRDTTPPSFICPPNLVLECPADTRTNATGVPIAQDACGSVALSYSDIVSNGCGGSKVISRLWVATDQCGNSTNGVQTITVRDTTAPSLRLPPNVVLQCPGDTRTNVTGVPIVVDGCSSVAVSYSDIVSNSCGATRTVWRTWTATDQCGNTTNGLQTINVIDTTPPRIVCPSIAVQCVDDVPRAYTNLASFLAAGGTASDTCDPAPAFSFISDSGLVGSCPGRVTRVYRLTDACGNSADGIQTIVVDDTIPPVLTCPSNAVVECGSSLDPASIGRATATDNCSTNVFITYSDTMLSSQYDIKLYAADPGTNSGPYAPTYLKLAPGSLPCPSSARLLGRAADPLRNAVAYGPTSATLDALTSMGGAPMCLGQIVPFEAVIQVSGAPGPERGTIEFTASWSTYTTSNDNFGYDTNYMVYCAFVDTADPGEWDQYDNAKVDSYSSVVVNPGTINEQIQGTFRVSGLESGDRVVVEIWVVLMSNMPDHVSGTISAALVSAQKDTVPPQPITVGVQTTSIGNLNKLSPLPPPQPQPPLGPMPPTPPTLLGRDIAVMNRTWTATDTCSNQSTCVQQITIRDTAPPVLTLPPDVVLEFPADTSTNTTGVAQAIDACSPPVTISYSDVVTNGCGGSEVIARTWTAIDDSGNSTNAVQTIRVQDTTPPVIIAPADRVLEYPANTATNVTGVATATDASGTVAITFSDSTSNVCGVAYAITRTWRATDVCGNASSAIQQINVRDTRPPSLVPPPDLVLEFPADTTTNSTGVASAQDVSGVATLSFSDSVTNTCGTCESITRTWAAVDTCGNSTSAVQQITVRDTTPPTIHPALVKTFTVEQFAGVAAPQVLDTNCFSALPNGIMIGALAPDLPKTAYHGLCYSADLSGLAALQSALGQTLTASGPITVTATNSADLFGGGSLAQQAIALTLNIGLNAAGKSGPAPNNFGSLVYSNANDSLNGQSTGQILDQANLALAGQNLPSGYDFNALTALLNQLNGAYQGSTNSTWASAFLSTPKSIAQCAGQVPSPNPNEVIVSDNSGGPITVTNMPDVVSGMTCPSHYLITRTWVAIDPCGNSNSCQVLIEVNDTTPPVLTVGADRSINWGDAWQFDDPVATDNCGPATLSILNTVTNLLGTNLVVTRTWEATDACGNSTTNQQAITIAIQPPAIVSGPQNQETAQGTDLVLTVDATGSGPLQYQWFFDGTAIAGATGSSLDLAGMNFTNAGLYTVRVSNLGGSTTSAAAIVNVAPTISISRDGLYIILTWPAPFILQSAASAPGPYVDVPGATSPYRVLAIDPQRFFRLRSPDFAVNVQYLPDGHASIEVTGLPGVNFILQATTDFVNWVNLETNTAPATIIDTAAGEFPLRFYRIVPLVPSDGTPPAIISQPQGQTAEYGSTATLRVTASGSGPLLYQWLRNGTAIPGATASSTTLQNISFSDAGVYSVLVGNAAGTVTSAGAIVSVAPRLSIQRNSNTTLLLTWPGSYVLQSAPQAAGPYSDVPGAVSPYVYNIGTTPQLFFRLR